MGTISIGGHDVAIDLVLFLSSTAVWLLIAVRMVGPNAVGIGALLAKTLVFSMLAARAVFVIAHYEQYQSAPWRMLNVSDGGFIIFAGFVAATLATLAFGWRQKPMLHALVSALMAGLFAWSLGLQVFWLVRTDTVRLPAFSLVDLGGHPVDIQDFSGQPVVVNLWATWCPPCRREMPLLRDAQKSEKGIVFIFADQAESAKTVSAYLTLENLSLRNVLLDPLGQFAIHAGSQAVPTTLFFNDKGVLIKAHKGELSATTLRQHLDLLHPVTSTSMGKPPSVPVSAKNVPNL